MTANEQVTQLVVPDASQVSGTIGRTRQPLALPWPVATPEVDALAPRWPTAWSPLPLPTVPERPMPRAPRRVAGAHPVWKRAAGLMPNGALVAVSGPDGGLGRSTLVAALGGLLAMAAPQPVLAVDATARPWGGLEHRTTLRSPSTTRDAVALAATLDTLADFAPLMQHAPGDLHVLLGESGLDSMACPTFTELAPVIARARPWHSVTLLDLPTADVEGAQIALWAATAPVLVARAGVDSLRHVGRLLNRLADDGLGSVASAAIVVVMGTAPGAGREVARHLQALRSRVETIRVLFDPQLAHALPVELGQLRRTTLAALMKVAASVLARCPAQLEPPIWQVRPEAGGDTR